MFTRYAVYQNGKLTKTVTPFKSEISGDDVTLEFGDHTCKALNARLNEGLLAVSVPIVDGSQHVQKYASVTPKDVTDWTEALKEGAESAYALGPGALPPYVRIGPCGLFARASNNLFAPSSAGVRHPHLMAPRYIRDDQITQRDAIARPLRSTVAPSQGQDYL